MDPSESSSSPVSRVACPLCGGDKHRVLEWIRLADLEHEYRRQLGVTILGEFKSGVDRLSLRLCETCGMGFFDPAPAGSAAFYEAISRSQQYYSTTRWEFVETLRILGSDPHPDLVDVGCGDGAFLALVSGDRKRGLELNPDAVRRAQEQGLDVREGLLPVLPDASADYITMFQVLEHVERPVEVLNETARVLRSGGRLIVAVPNNDAYIGRSLQDPLNAPPHHPLRWREEALRFVPRVAPFDLEDLLLEPLSTEHLYHYRRAQFLQAVFGLIGRRMPLYRVSSGMTLVRRMANVWTRLSLKLAPRGPTAPGTGFSVMAVYRRRAT